MITKGVLASASGTVLGQSSTRHSRRLLLIELINRSPSHQDALWRIKFLEHHLHDLEAFLAHDSACDELSELLACFDGAVILRVVAWSEHLSHLAVVPERYLIVGLVLAVDETLDGVAIVVQNEPAVTVSDFPHFFLI